ncbi:MAG: 2-amino-4-hydroxy-6-hydroxymethyldihydropteridine diphosphokinase [Anaerolineaceae bacterium]
MSERVFIGLGTNLGERSDNLARARALLAERVVVKAVSSVYETKPWGYLDQPDFLNQVIEVETDLTPTKLLNLLKRVEKKMGRERNFRNGPRLIDLDILLFGDRVLHTARLNIPHPQITERAFVLVPLAEIAPEMVHPVLYRSVTDLLTELPDRDEVKKCK